MQDVIAELVRRFDIQFAEGMTENVWWEGVKDRFTLATGPLIRDVGAPIRLAQVECLEQGQSPANVGIDRPLYY
jgi:hypothetical protein